MADCGMLMVSPKGIVQFLVDVCTVFRDYKDVGNIFLYQEEI